ncbi:LacI family DNA-binding transcriptional regulator, partial [Enterococcus faecalis]|nr:LacI family DNA-binding transcriptional regulator [Enterococcus faecalis]
MNILYTIIVLENEAFIMATIKDIAKVANVSLSTV